MIFAIYISDLLVKVIIFIFQPKICFMHISQSIRLYTTC